MVNTRTDADLSAAVQNALQTLLPQICAEIREEFRMSSGPSDAGGNPPPQAKGGDAWLITVTWAEFKKLFFLQFFPRAEHERLKREYHSIRQMNTETSTEFMQRFLRLAGFLGAAAGTEEEQAKNFQWGLRKSTLNHLMCMPFTDVAQVANAARNYEILHERNNDDAERPDKRRVVIDFSRPLNGVVTGTTVIIMTVMDQTGEAVVTTTAAATTTTLATTGECHRAAGTCFKCGHAGHLQKDCKKNTNASTSGQAYKKPGASGHVFVITEDHATKTSAGKLGQGHMRCLRDVRE
nr:hypothetical protein [Tanacetum cinerariifolium]